MKEKSFGTRFESVRRASFPPAYYGLPDRVSGKERANLLFDTFIGDVSDLSFLDYQMDEHVMREAKQRGARFKRPFDKVLMFDVLDHLQEDPVEVLAEVAGVLAPTGCIFLRCHPWCSRHATHPDYANNKAYLHLLLSEEERKILNITGFPGRRETLVDPLMVYRDWLREAKLEVLYEEPIVWFPEKFFIYYGQKYLDINKLSPVQFVDYIVSQVVL